jgi:hypothetical protein
MPEGDLLEETKRFAREGKYEAALGLFPLAARGVSCVDR